MDDGEDDLHSDHSDTTPTFWTPPATPPPNGTQGRGSSSDSTASDNAHMDPAYRRRTDDAVREHSPSNGRPVRPRRRRSQRHSESRWDYLPPEHYTATARRRPPRRRHTNHTSAARNRLSDESSSSSDETEPDAPARRRSPRRNVQPDYEEFILETEDTRPREQRLRELVDRHRQIDDDVVEVIERSPPRRHSVRSDEHHQANQSSPHGSARRAGTGLSDHTSTHRQLSDRNDERRQANQPDPPRSANRTRTGLSDATLTQAIAPDVSQPLQGQSGSQLLLRRFLGPGRSGNDQVEATLSSTHGLPNLTGKSATWFFYVVSSPTFLATDSFRLTKIAIRDGIIQKLNGAATNIRYRDLLDAAPSPTDRGSIQQIRDMLRTMNVWSVIHVTPYQPNSAHRVAPWLDRFRQPGHTSLFSQWEPTSESFSVGDLDIYSLRDLGDLHIEWTDNAEQHLELVRIGSEGQDASEDDEPDELRRHGSSDEERKSKRKKGTTLLIFWFDCKEFSWLAKYLCKFFENDLQAQSFAHEIIQSWSFLFHHREEWHRGRIRKEYRNLPIPSYIEGYLDSIMGDESLDLDTLGDILDKGLDSHIFEIRQHLSPNLRKFNESQKGEYFYSDFLVFGRRISKLRQHMDSRKPRGFWQLWKDNRDSLGYYTFWAAIIFGGIALILALLSFVASIVQTWASVKALRLSQQSSAPSG